MQSISVLMLCAFAAQSSDPWLLVDSSTVQPYAGGAFTLDGNTLYVGDAGDDYAGFTNAGSVLVYERVGSTWTGPMFVRPSDPSNSKSFGDSFAIEGDVLLVGAPSDDNAHGTNAGAAYVFARSGGTWIEQVKILASDGVAGDGFGSAIALENDRLAISATDTNPVGPPGPTGTVYVYQSIAGIWTEDARLTGTLATGLGAALTLQGDTLVAGAPNSVVDFSLNQAGAVYVFVKQDGAWSTQAYLTSNQPSSLMHFGVRVSLDGDMLAVGCPGDPTIASDTGAVYIFDRSGSAWSQTAKIRNQIDASHFGSGVSLRANRLIATATSADVGAVRDAGTVHVFDRVGSEWHERFRVHSPTPTQFGLFGAQVQRTDDELAVSSGSSIRFYGISEAPRTCFGDGSAGDCPCAPPNVVPSPSGEPNAGCGNSFDLGGGRLVAEGTQTPDCMRLRAEIGPSYSGFAFLVKGDAHATLGIANGDGLRCVDGTLVRFGGHNAGSNGDPSGTWTYPNTAQTASVSAATAQPTAQTAHYQVIYRNAAAAFCSSGTTNWTNSVQLDW